MNDLIQTKAASAPRGTDHILTLLFLTLALAVTLLASGWTDARQWALVDRKLPNAVRVATRTGPTDSIAYYRHDRFGKPYYYRLASNGFSMSSTDFRSKRYMKLYVNLPLAIHPGMDKALLIGYGVGSTAKALTDTAELEQIDIVDISRDILDLAEIVYPDPADHPLNDPRVQIRVDDGRFFLRATRDRYDLITSEPPPPKNAGVVNLYSREFFQLAHDRLADGGIMTHWLPVYQMDLDEAKAITRAFLDVFPDATLWEGGGLNWMLMGTRDCPGPGTAERFAQQWQDPVVGPELIRLGIELPAQLGATFIGDAPFLADWTGDTLPLTDAHPLRMSADIARGRDQAPLFAAIADNDARTRFRKSAWIKDLCPARLRSESLTHFNHQRLLEAVLGSPYRSTNPAGRLPELHRVLTGTELQTLPLVLLGTNPFEAELAESSDSLHAAYLAACRRVAERDVAGAEEKLSSALPHTEPGSLLIHLYVLRLQGKEEMASQLTESHAELMAQHPALSNGWAWMQEAL